MGTLPKYSSEVRQCAVRMVREHQQVHDSQWAAITSIAAKVGCTAETLCWWLGQAECDTGVREGRAVPSEREWRSANGILRKASAYFA